MDRQTEAKIRYERLRETLADEKKNRRKALWARSAGIIMVGVWAIVPVLSWDVNLEEAAQAEFFRRPTPHEAHLLALVSESPGENSPARRWEAEAYRSIDRPFVMDRAYLEEGLFLQEVPQAIGVRVHIPEGQRLRLELDAQWDEDVDQGRQDRLFVDVFRAAPRGDEWAEGDPDPRPAFLKGEEFEGGRWTFDPSRGGDFVLRIQPELKTQALYVASLRVGARWDFPVANSGRSDIGSVFGDPREGGAREHHGVDIFSPRGTAALAAADSRVTRVDTTNIGGRVVWLREAEGGHSIYYAHLDKPLVRRGQQLQAGDTVGLVGNTGNARTTPPHLHFGAYRRGPVDPWDLIIPVPPEAPRLRVDRTLLGAEGQTRGGDVRLRNAPSSFGSVLATMTEGTPLRVLAGSGSWYRVALPGGKSGFVDPGSLVFRAADGTQPDDQS